MPWRSALDNVIVGLEFRGVPNAEAVERGNDWLRRVGLTGFGGSATIPQAMYFQLNGTVNAVPEPGAWVLFASGAGMLAAWRLRRQA